MVAAHDGPASPCSHVATTASTGSRSVAAQLNGASHPAASIAERADDLLNEWARNSPNDVAPPT